METLNLSLEHGLHIKKKTKMNLQNTNEIFNPLDSRAKLEAFDNTESWQHLFESIRDSCEEVFVDSARDVQVYFTQAIHELLQGDHVVTAKEHAGDINWFEESMPAWVLKQFRVAIEGNKSELLFNCESHENTKQVSWKSLTR